MYSSYYYCRIHNLMNASQYLTVGFVATVTVYNCRGWQIVAGCRVECIKGKDGALYQSEPSLNLCVNMIRELTVIVR